LRNEAAIRATSGSARGVSLNRKTGNRVHRKSFSHVTGISTCAKGKSAKPHRSPATIEPLLAPSSPLL
jgi:hypothetical protein